MQFATRPARVLAAACLVVGTLLAALPAPAAALEPPRPLPNYRPAFVTETDTRPWTDCLWSSAAMLLDKWTNGEVQVSRQALRRASGDMVGGSSFDDMKVAFAKHHFRVEFSPDGGTKITWGQMLSRLERGAGAVLLGDYSQLPRYYGRWDYAFWKKTGAEDNHAVYVERYDRKRGRVWLMDPLGRDGYRGEWISTHSLRRYAWSSGGAMYVAMTPTAKAAPFAGVKVSRPAVVLSPTAVDATWTLRVPKKWRFPGGDVATQFTTPDDALRAAAESPGVPVRHVGAEAPADGRASVQGKSLHVAAPLPATPGAYVASLSLRDRRFGDVFVRSRKVAIFVPGPRRATMRLNVRETGAEAGSTLEVSVNVANSGIETWADTRTSVTGGTQRTVVRGTRAVARWIPLPAVDAPRTAAGAVSADAAGPAPTTLGPVALAPGRMIVLRESLLVPDAAGRWALVIDILDDVAGSFAAIGSAPAVTIIDVVPTRGIQPVE